MFGIDDALIGTVAGGLISNIFADDRQSNQQQFNQEQQATAQTFNSAEAATNREFQNAQAQKTRDYATQMSNTAYQRQVQDMSAAGLNPMLALMKNGASTPTTSTPTGSTASVSPASSGIASPANEFNFTAALQTASNVKMQEAQIEKTAAETSKAQAEQKEIEARTPTYAINIDTMKQQIEQSKTAVQKMIQETSTSAYSAQNIAQQTINMQAELPKIQAMVENLKALTRYTAGAETNRANAQAQEATMGAHVKGMDYQRIQNEVQANLPAIEAAYKKLETTLKGTDLPQAQGKASVYGAGGGNQGAFLEFLRAINPLQGIFK